MTSTYLISWLKKFLKNALMSIMCINQHIFFIFELIGIARQVRIQQVPWLENIPPLSKTFKYDFYVNLIIVGFEEHFFKILQIENFMNSNLLLGKDRVTWCSVPFLFLLMPFMNFELAKKSEFWLGQAKKKKKRKSKWRILYFYLPKLFCIFKDNLIYLEIILEFGNFFLICPLIRFRAYHRGRGISLKLGGQALNKVIKEVA